MFVQVYEGRRSRCIANQSFSPTRDLFVCPCRCLNDFGSRQVVAIKGNKSRFPAGASGKDHLRRCEHVNTGHGSETAAWSLSKSHVFYTARRSPKPECSFIRSTSNGRSSLLPIHISYSLSHISHKIHAYTHTLRAQPWKPPEHPLHTLHPGTHSREDKARVS